MFAVHLRFDEQVGNNYKGIQGFSDLVGELIQDFILLAVENNIVV